MKKRNSKIVFSEVLDNALEKITASEERCHPWDSESDTYTQITGKEEAK